MPQFQSISFAPGVGPVMFVTGAGEKFTLQTATVNGKKYPVTAPASGVTSKLVFDKTWYTNQSNTIRCITTPCPGNAVTAIAKFTYTVTNGTSSTQTWQFGTGCQFDLQLADASGKVLRSLGEGRICTQALTSITLAPGSSKVISGQVDLVDATGEQLSGTLSAKAYLIPRSGVVFTPVAPASASLSVSIVPAIP